MASLERDSHRIVIAGASSMLGAELRSLLEESRFAAADFRLVDEEVAAGTLMEAGGEPAVIQPVEEGSFDRASVVFFTGSGEFTRRNFAGAKGAGAKVVDLSGGMAAETRTVAWLPKLDSLTGREFARNAAAYLIPSAGAAAAAGMALALSKCGLRKLVIVLFQPVSEAGRPGIEELESQTGQLLSLQAVGRPVFDAQVAFNMLESFGPASGQKLGAIRKRVSLEVEACLGAIKPIPAVQVVHAPVFYGTTFAAWAEADPSANIEKVTSGCREAGFALLAEDGESPSNVSAAGETVIQIAKPEADRSQAGAWWFWGATDNIRLPAWNAVKLAEILS